MKFGIGLFWGGMEPHDLADVARRAEELGYESVWIWDHIVYPKTIRSRYPYTPDGSPPFADYRTLDPWITLAHIAAVTSKIRLGTNIYILPLRNPFITARAITTLDILSGGRAILGAGVGWLQEEFSLLDQDFHTRGARSDEIILILKALWTQDEPQFHGRFYSFDPVKFDPKPLQKPHPPILIGGETEPALRRAARLGNGWISSGALETLETATQKAEKLRALLREYGREGEPFEIMMNAGPWAEVDTVRRFEAAGVTRLLVAPWFRPDITAEMAEEGTAHAYRAEHIQGASIKEGIMNGLERYATEVLSRLG